MDSISHTLKREIEELRDQELILREMADQALVRRRRLESELVTRAIHSVAGPNHSRGRNLAVTSTEDGFLSTPHAAARLGVSPDTVARYVAEGILKAVRYRPGGPYRIYKSSVDELLSRRAGPGSARASGSGNTPNPEE